MLTTVAWIKVVHAREVISARADKTSRGTRDEQVVPLLVLPKAQVVHDAKVDDTTAGFDIFPMLLVKDHHLLLTRTVPKWSISQPRSSWNDLGRARLP
jgi:hypothetical protein